MKFEVEKSFPMPACPEVAWQFLQNIEGVATCMPGAKITEQLDATHYKGTVGVRVGPASMSFKGDIEVIGVDSATRSVHLGGKGSDATGTSGAAMDLNARIEATDDGRCNLVGRSEVSLTGKAATFGGRMMGTVTDQLLKQFAANFAAQVEALQAAQSAGGNNAAAATVAVAAAPPAQAQELNGLLLIWVVIKAWFRSLFSGKAA